MFMLRAIKEWFFGIDVMELPRFLDRRYFYEMILNMVSDVLKKGCKDYVNKDRWKKINIKTGWIKKSNLGNCTQHKCIIDCNITVE